VGCTCVVVSRVYPLTYLEKRDGAKNVFRSERQERKLAANHERARQKKIEDIATRIQREFEDEISSNKRPCRRSRRLNTLQIKQLHDGEEIHNALGNATDPVAFQVQCILCF